jgi:hypothetical protein
MPFSRPEFVIGMFLLSDPVMYHHVDAGDAMLGSMAASLYFWLLVERLLLLQGYWLKKIASFPALNALGFWFEQVTLSKSFDSDLEYFIFYFKT